MAQDPEQTVNPHQEVMKVWTVLLAIFAETLKRLLRSAPSDEGVRVLAMQKGRVGLSKHGNETLNLRSSALLFGTADFRRAALRRACDE